MILRGMGYLKKAQGRGRRQSASHQARDRCTSATQSTFSLLAVPSSLSCPSSGVARSQVTHTTNTAAPAANAAAKGSCRGLTRLCDILCFKCRGCFGDWRREVGAVNALLVFASRCKKGRVYRNQRSPVPTPTVSRQKGGGGTSSR